MKDTRELERRLLVERVHSDCEDCWYSCAKLTCNEVRKSDVCDCGADEENALCREAAAALASQREELERLREALGRLSHSYRLLLSGKPVRDVSETLAEVDAVLSSIPAAPATEKEKP